MAKIKLPKSVNISIAYVMQHLTINDELATLAEDRDELAYRRGWHDAFAMFLGDLTATPVKFVITKYADKFVDFRFEDEVEKLEIEE